MLNRALTTTEIIQVNINIALKTYIFLGFVVYLRQYRDETGKQSMLSLYNAYLASQNVALK